MNSQTSSNSEGPEMQGPNDVIDSQLEDAENNDREMLNLAQTDSEVLNTHDIDESFPAGENSNSNVSTDQREKEIKSPVTENSTEQTNVTSEISDEKNKDGNEKTADKKKKDKQKKKKKERTDKTKEKKKDQSGSSSKLNSFCHSDKVSQNPKKDVSAGTVQTSVVRPQITENVPVRITFPVGPFSKMPKPGPADENKLLKPSTTSKQVPSRSKDNEWRPTTKGKRTPGQKVKSSEVSSESSSQDMKLKKKKKSRLQDDEIKKLSDQLIKLNELYQEQNSELKKLSDASRAREKKIDEMAVQMIELLDILRRRESAASQRDLEPRIEDSSGHPAVGFIEQSTQRIHIGQGVMVDLNAYNNAEFKARSDAGFIKNMAMLIFTIEELLTSTPTGSTSNYRKVNETKPALDPTRMKALEDLYVYRLMKKYGMSRDKAEEEARKQVRVFVGGKISDLRRPQRARCARPSTDRPNSPPSEPESGPPSKRRRTNDDNSGASSSQSADNPNRTLAISSSGENLENIPPEIPEGHDGEDSDDSSSSSNDSSEDDDESNGDTE